MGRKKIEKEPMDRYAEQALKEFGEFIKAKRERANLTMREAGEEIGITSAYVSNIENAKLFPPSYTVLEKMVDTYKIKGDERRKFFHLANKCRSSLPIEIVSLLNQNISLYDIIYRLGFVRDICIDDNNNLDNEKISRILDAVSMKFKQSIKEVLYKEFPSFYDESGELIEELRGFDLDF